jgi:hypothetical protein
MNSIKTLFCALAIALINSQAGAQNSVAPPSAGRAAMLIASADNPQHPVVHLGSTVWSLFPPAPNQPGTVAVKAEADIPDLKMHATMTLRKNTDPTLQATHTIDLKFSFAEGAPITGFKDVGLPQMRKEDSTAAEALTSVKVKISSTFRCCSTTTGSQRSCSRSRRKVRRCWKRRSRPGGLTHRRHRLHSHPRRAFRRKRRPSNPY